MAVEFGSDFRFGIVVERDSARIALLLRLAFRVESTAGEKENKAQRRDKGSRQRKEFPIQSGSHFPEFPGSTPFSVEQFLREHNIPMCAISLELPFGSSMVRSIFLSLGG